MPVAASKITRITSLLHDIGIFLKTPPIMYFDNLMPFPLLQTPCFMSNETYRNRLSFRSKKVANDTLVTPLVLASGQLVDIFSKALSKTPFANTTQAWSPRPFNPSLDGK